MIAVRWELEQRSKKGPVGSVDWDLPRNGCRRRAEDVRRVAIVY